MEKFIVATIALTIISAAPIDNKKDMLSDYICSGPEIKNRTECLLIMANKVLQTSFLEIQQSQFENLHLTKRSASAARQRASACDFTGNYLATHTKPNRRSLSPYKQSISFNVHRRPRYISQKWCLCTGCVNPRTLKETHTLRSVNLTQTIDVYWRDLKGKFQLRKEKIFVGCTCTFPVLS